MTMNGSAAEAMQRRRDAARRTALIMGGVALTIFGLFWLSGFLGR
jgi:hypothetical protein